LSLKLILELDKKKVAIGNMPEATLRLLNEGQEMIIVNARMLLAPASTPKKLKEVDFMIAGPEDSINLKKFQVNAGPPALENFARLFPGEYIFKTFDLNKYFLYKTPGNYKIMARYNNVISVKVHDRFSWTGTLLSNDEYVEMYR
jgi:hypothetical protein